jgi:hypothetical protein
MDYINSTGKCFWNALFLQEIDELNVEMKAD